MIQPPDMQLPVEAQAAISGAFARSRLPIRAMVTVRGRNYFEAEVIRLDGRRMPPAQLQLLRDLLQEVLPQGAVVVVIDVKVDP